MKRRIVIFSGEGKPSKFTNCRFVNDESHMFDDDVPPDASRTFAPPPHEPLPRGRTLAWTVLALALIGAGVLMLLAPGPAHSQSVVWVGSR